MVQSYKYIYGDSMRVGDIYYGSIIAEMFLKLALKDINVDRFLRNRCVYVFYETNF